MTLSKPLPLVLVRWNCRRCRRFGFVEAPVGFEMLEALVQAHGTTCPNRKVAFFRRPASWCEFVPLELPGDGGEDEMERARRQGTRPPLEIVKPEASWTRN